MKPFLSRRAAVTLVLALCFGGMAPLRAGEAKREKLGSFRFALRNLPPLLAPAPPTYAYLKNGKNENPYEDELGAGGLVGCVERRESAGPRDTPEAFAQYTLYLITKGNPTTRRYVFESDKFRVRLLFPNVSVFDPGPKPDAKALRRAFGRHIVFNDP